MNALLDTHTFLWWVVDAPQLSKTAKDFIANPNNKIFFSTASAWEIVIKVGTGKLILSEEPATYITSRLTSQNYLLPRHEYKHRVQYQQLYKDRQQNNRVCLNVAPSPLEQHNPIFAFE
jgi:PIN domain nuclease of toxin-antitoxin system